MTTWWQGTALVLERSLREQVRSKWFRIVTALLLLAALAVVIVPQLTGGGPPTYTLATVGAAPAELRGALAAAGEAGEFRTSFVELADEADVRRAIQQTDATVGLAGDRMYVAARDAGAFPSIVSQVVVRLETSELLGEFGLTAEQIGRLESVQPPEQVWLAPVADEGRAGVGYAVGLVLYMALLFSGQLIATTVATEKSTRISEVLLAVLRPSQVMVGTVLAVGAIAIFQLLVLAVPVVIGAAVTDSDWLPPVTGPDLALAIVWFVLGFGLFAFLYAAGGALVDKVTEAGTAVLPVTFLIIAGYLLGVVVVAGGPDEWWSVAVSMFPLTAPLTMPIRWGSGDVPTYQLVIALVLTAMTAVACVWLASAIYRRALVITGHRVRLRELRGRRPR